MPVMRWREIRQGDLPACFSMRPGNLGDEIIGRDAALSVWRGLFRNPAFHGIVIESDPPVRGHRIVSCGAGVFVAPDFMSAEIAEPRPWLNSRVIAGIARGRSVLLPYSEIGRANAGAGIDTVSLLGSWISEGLGPEEVVRISGLLAASFLEVHRGYRLNRLLRELPCGAELESVRGLFRVIGTFQELDRYTVLLTKTDALAAPYSIACLMFEYNAPVLGLSDADRQLLVAALKLPTDDQLSAELGLSGAAVKKRWHSIFGKVAKVKSDLFENLEPVDGSGRGRQKRHHVLSYVRDHPEELRPYARQKGGG